MELTRSVQIGDVTIGGTAPVAVQTMTNTLTSDVEATVQQVLRIADAGADLVRITVPKYDDIQAIQSIKTKLRHEGCTIPLIADVHYNPLIAEEVASIVEKVRINPGNYVDKRTFKQLDLTDVEYDEALNRMCGKAERLFKVCKEHGTAIRIGTNHGSLCDRIVSRYGNTPLAMAKSAMEWIDICNYYDYHNVVLSLKSSNVITMIDSTIQLTDLMKRAGQSYPLHLGVTEAGNGTEGRAKSAAGIGALLLMGLGNTIRVSLTEKPENEVPFAKLLLDAVHEIKLSDYELLSDGTLLINVNEPNEEKWLAKTAAIAGFQQYQHKVKQIVLHNNCFNHAQNLSLADTIMQACRIKMSKTEIISCPSCGRTQYDIESLVALVKANFSNYPGLKLGVMGCVVNGPGEMADADFGIVGATNNKVAVYRNKNRISDFLSVEEAFSLLKKLIEESYS